MNAKSAQQKLAALCRRLQYKFNNINILQQALTHCSAGAANYERLEFLGDSLLSNVITYALFEKFPEQNEGQLSRLRAHLVRGEMLALIAGEINLGDYLFLGQGELKSGGFRRASILADALEAVFAAVFLDSDFTECRRVILAIYDSRLQDPLLLDKVKDYKTQLQEYLQAKKATLPEYILTKIEGEEHQQIFHITCRIKSLSLESFGDSDTRRRAEQIAAKKLLQQLQ